MPLADPLDDCWVPTPPELARRMVERAAIKPNARVLEPSAGEGALVRALFEIDAVRVVSIEKSAARVRRLRALEKVERSEHLVVFDDFFHARLDTLGAFDAVVMSPPFHAPDDARADLTHVRHALTFLPPGGRLVAILHSRLLDGDARAREFLHALGRFELEYLPPRTFATAPQVAAFLLSYTKR